MTGGPDSRRRRSRSRGVGRAGSTPRDPTSGRAVRRRCDRGHGGTDRSGRSRRPDRGAVRADSGGARPTAPEERADPIGDERWSPVPGIVHRYPDRVLLKPTLLCPVYCRFCFRREVVGKKGAMLDQAALERAFDYIRQRPQIWEVIVTGGDPFLLAPRRIARYRAHPRPDPASAVSSAFTPAFRWSIRGG